jgi:ubiquinone/menaquinone biosynthesis C-methylase UbiE
MFCFVSDMDPILRLLRPIYYLLYHQFAWSYDFVAALVSLGHWNDWVRTALPHLEGRVLELGFGPGHLQQAMFDGGLQPFGVDESRQMARQARRRLTKVGRRLSLTRGRARHLAFPEATFDRVVATFPSEYIFEPEAIHEIGRVLVPGGRLVIVPMAWITGSKPLERIAAWVFRITGETAAPENLLPAIKARFTAGGFEVRHEMAEAPGSRVLVLIAEKGHQRIHR